MFSVSNEKKGLQYIYFKKSLRYVYFIQVINNPGEKYVVPQCAVPYFKSQYSSHGSLLHVS